jgi:hypothetical protein
MQKRGLPSESTTKKSPKAASRASKGRRKSGRGMPGFLKLGLAIAAVGGLGYCVSQSSGVAYGEDALRVVDFSILDASEKRLALREANTQRCGCGCGMQLAQCVSTDSTCPIREPNIARIKEIVQKANRP